MEDSMAVVSRLHVHIQYVSVGIIHMSCHIAYYSSIIDVGILFN